MSRISWNNAGERFFEAGVSQGVLYPKTTPGVPWNGLISVTDTSIGGEPRPLYVDGVKRAHRYAKSEYSGSIAAFTYPDEFEDCDGVVTLLPGMSATQQRRKSFGLSFRTGLGNDSEGLAHGYKLHLLYNVLAEPSDKAYASLGDAITPVTFTWAFTTRPVNAKVTHGLAPMSHIVLDSTKLSPSIMYVIEMALYGSPDTQPRLPDLEELLDMADNPPIIQRINARPSTGLSPLTEDVDGDLVGLRSSGLYSRTENSRLVETATPGLYILE